MNGAARASLMLAWRYLRGRGLRSLLTSLAVALGVMLVFGLNGVLPTIMDTFNRSIMSAAGKIDISVSSTLAQPFSPAVLDRVARVDGIGVATGEVEQQAPLPVRPDVPVADQVSAVTVVGVDPAVTGRVRDYPIVTGRVLTTSDTTAVVLAADLAGRLGMGPGSQLALPSQVGTTRFTVVGLTSTPTVGGQERVYVPLTAAQQLFGLGDKLTVVQASLTPGADRGRVEDAVRTAVGTDYTVGGLSTNASLLASLQTSKLAFTLFGVFAVVTAGFIILNSFRTMVAERRRDIGMLRAIGARRRTVTGMFLAEALLQGAVGTVLGMVLGYGMAAGLFAVMGPLFESVAHLTMGPLRFESTAYVQTIALGMGVTVVAALIPARAAGRITPMEALRPVTEESYRASAGMRAWIGLAALVASVFCLVTRVAGLVGVGAVLFLIGIALVTPAVVNPLAHAFGYLVEVAFSREGALARSNLQRNPGRSAVTVTAVMLGLASIVAMVTVIQSIFAGFLGYIDKSLSADYMVIPQSIVLSQGNVAAGPELAQEIRHTPGIGPVSSLRIARGKLNGRDVQVIGIDPAGYLKVAALDWNEGSSDAAVGQLATGRWLIGNGIFSSQAGLVPGQAVTLDTPNGQRTYHVAGIGNDYLNAKVSTIYVSQDLLARDFNVSSDMLIMANRLPSADPVATKAALDRVVRDYPGFRLYEASQWRAEQERTFSTTLGIFDALIAALAVPSLLALLNTLAMSVLARTREIGMLRAVGATRRQVRRMVVAESLLLSVIGTAFGVVSGVWLGYALVQAMKNVGWPMPYTFPYGGVLLTMVVGIVFGVLAALVPARSAARLDVVAALHHE
ncbi:ABC transporter permease [Raineyella sp.]|uniref:ABC transporter permease n=1 Tax=Raineyella sp. TaxID=1911550 RepID=UPI002B1F470C|nr:FtsX-like permease family protein [Raineyella sp.]MEA5155043.1 FtsX-like permease family protein [Raineyella sp.]